MFWKDPFAPEPHKLIPVRQEDRDLLASYNRGRQRSEVRESRQAREPRDEVSRLRAEMAAAREEAAAARAENARLRERADMTSDVAQLRRRHVGTQRAAQAPALGRRARAQPPRRTDADRAHVDGAGARRRALPGARGPAAAADRRRSQRRRPPTASSSCRCRRRQPPVVEAGRRQSTRVR